MSCFLDLPDDVVNHTFGFVDLASLARLREASKKVKISDSVWAQLVLSLTEVPRRVPSRPFNTFEEELKNLVSCLGNEKYELDSFSVPGPSHWDRPHRGDIEAVAIAHRDGSNIVYSAGIDGQLKAWNEGVFLTEAPPTQAYETIKYISASSSGYDRDVVICLALRPAKIIINDAESLLPLLTTEELIDCSALDVVGSLMAYVADSQLIVQDWTKLPEEVAIKSISRHAQRIAILREKKLVLVLDTNQIARYDCSGSSIAQLSPAAMPVSEIPVDLIASCFPGRDAEFIVTTRRGNVLVFDACSGNLTRHIGVSGKTIRCIHLPKIGLGRLAVCGSFDEQLHVVDLDAETVLRRFTGDKQSADWPLMIASMSDLLVVVYDTNVIKWFRPNKIRERTESVYDDILFNS